MATHERTLDVTISWNDENETFSLLLREVQSGIHSYMYNIPYSPDEHPEFNESIGNEIYTWLDIWKDAEEKGKGEKEEEAEAQ